MSLSMFKLLGLLGLGLLWVLEYTDAPQPHIPTDHGLNEQEYVWYVPETPTQFPEADRELQGP